MIREATEMKSTVSSSNFVAEAAKTLDVCDAPAIESCELG